MPILRLLVAALLGIAALGQRGVALLSRRAHRRAEDLWPVPALVAEIVAAPQLSHAARLGGGRMARTEGFYKESARNRAMLRSARSAGLPAGKPRGSCWQPGCTAWGVSCFFPDRERGGPGGNPREHPGDRPCDRHIKHGGFCKGRGNFEGGTSRSTAGSTAIPAAATAVPGSCAERGDGDDRCYDGGGHESGIVIVGGRPEEVFGP